MGRLIRISLVLATLPLILWSGEALAFSTHDTTLSRTFDKLYTTVGDSVEVTVEFTNSETEEVRGFSYSENIPEDLSVITISVKIDGVDVSNYVFASGTVGDVYPGCVPYLWILETPPFDEDNPVPSGSSVEIVYSASYADEGTFGLDEFHWVGYYEGPPERERAAFGHSELEDEETITFSADCICTDLDEDGYGDPACKSCTYPELDCDDSEGSANPGAAEVCDGMDNNCASGVDEDPAASDSCNNGLFCDGQEYCDSGSCQMGAAPCPDNGLWCDGEEACEEGIDQCVHSGDPCSASGLVCDEDQDICVDPIHEFSLSSPLNGSRLSNPPVFGWNAGRFNLFGLYLYLPIFGSYLPIPNPPPIWTTGTSFDLSPYPVLWYYVTQEKWAPWAVLGVDTETSEWEVAGPGWFQKMGP